VDADVLASDHDTAVVECVGERDCCGVHANDHDVVAATQRDVAEESAHDQPVNADCARWVVRARDQTTAGAEDGRHCVTDCAAVIDFSTRPMMTTSCCCCSNHCYCCPCLPIDSFPHLHK
jgi:hypothetical protein